MIISVGHVRFDAKDRDRVLAAVADVVAGSRKDPGCAEYTAAEVPDEAGHLLWIECWSDRAALDAHLQTDHVRTYREVVAPLIRERSWTRYEGSVGGSPGRG
jgi:quinol monooxygenase YgiN